MRAEDLEALGADVAAEEQALERLLASLARERAALVAGAAQEIEAAAAAKEHCAAELAAAGARREARLARCGVRSGMREALARAAHEPTLAAAWQRLLQRAREAKAANEANGALLAVRSQIVGARLALLASFAPGTTYGPRGIARASAPGRSLGAI